MQCVTEAFVTNSTAGLKASEKGRCDTVAEESSISFGVSSWSGIS